MSETPFRRIDPAEIMVNPFNLMVKDWMLITAGPPDAYNTMTAGWGGMGALWNWNVCFCVVRPTRYTYEFLEKEENFTLSFFDEQYRQALQLCGTKSGRDVDKAAATGLTPIAGSLARTTAFAQARMIMECRKVYTQDIDPSRFLDSKIEDLYPQKDYHRLYVGELVNCLTR